MADLEKKVSDTRAEISGIASAYAGTRPVVRQLVDLALLSRGLLKGEALSAFIKRSVELL